MAQFSPERRTNVLRLLIAAHGWALLSAVYWQTENDGEWLAKTHALLTVTHTLATAQICLIGVWASLSVAPSYLRLPGGLFAVSILQLSPQLGFVWEFYVDDCIWWSGLQLFVYVCAAAFPMRLMGWRIWLVDSPPRLPRYSATRWWLGWMTSLAILLAIVRRFAAGNDYIQDAWEYYSPWQLWVDRETLCVLTGVALISAWSVLSARWIWRQVVGICGGIAGTSWLVWSISRWMDDLYFERLDFFLFWRQAPHTIFGVVAVVVTSLFVCRGCGYRLVRAP